MEGKCLYDMGTDILDTFVEVLLVTPDDFLKVKETLTRIGVAPKRTRRLCQSCHILHKRGRYYIVHFKELFLLDGRETTLTEEDILRRNTISKLLSDWGMVKIVDVNKIEKRLPVATLKILPYKEKSSWLLESKYTVGVKQKL